MEKSKNLSKEIYDSYGDFENVLQIIGFIEAGKYINARALLDSNLYQFRLDNPTEIMLFSPEDVNNHNILVERLWKMESCYNEIMALVEKDIEYELLRQ